MRALSPLRFAARKVKSRALSPSERRALAPTVSKAAQLRYIALVTALSARVQAAIERHLLPRLPETARTYSPALVPLRQDSSGFLKALPCGPVPDWYTDVWDGQLVMVRPRYDALGDDYDDAFAALQAEIDEITRDVAVPLVEVGREVVRHSLAESDKVLGGVPGGAEAFDGLVQRFVRQNVGLIKSVQAQHLGRLQEIVSGSHHGTLRVEGLQAELQKAFNLPKARANLIARDQVLKLNNQITMERQTRAGIDSYVWTTSRDERVRGRPGGLWANSQSDHWALDGKEFKWAAPPVTNPVTGARNHPGQDFQCRCVAVPAVERILRGA